MGRKNKKNPIGDLPMLHRDLYNDMTYEEDLDRVNDYRNNIKDFFLKVVVKEGIQIRQQRVKTAQKRIEQIEELAENVERCKGLEEEDETHVLSLLGATIKSEQNRDGVLPRTLHYYLLKGKVNWARLDCVVGEMRRTWQKYLSEAKIGVQKESLDAFRNRTSPIEKEQSQTCQNFLNSTNKKQIITERDLDKKQVKEHEATIR